MRSVSRGTTVGAALAVFTIVGCGGDAKRAQPAPPSAAPGASADLTPFERENGIGPVTETLTLGALDPKLASQGKTVFEGKCTACHKMEEKYVGPALGQVTRRRTPAFIMNMILNPQEMIERHPVTKQLVAETMTFMANQGVTLEEARAIVEYLRTQAEGEAQDHERERGKPEVK